VNRRDIQRAGRTREPGPTNRGGGVHRWVDVVKVMANGGLTTARIEVMGTQFSADEMQLMVGLAHEAGLPITEVNRSP
jgi:imidazolonepropionase-like amidohydrolase